MTPSTFRAALRGARWVSTLALLAGSLTALAALIAQGRGSPFLAAWTVGLKFNAALSFAGLGLSLALLNLRLRAASAVVAAAIVLLMSAVAFEQTTGIGLGIDEWLYHDPTRDITYPGRLAPQVSTLLLMAAVSLTAGALRARRSRTAVWVAVGAAILLAGGTYLTLGRWFDRPATYVWFHQTPVARLAVLGLLLGGLAMLGTALALQARAWVDARRGLGPVLLAAGCALTILVHGSLYESERVSLEALLKARATALAARLERRFRSDQQALERMAERWRGADRPNRAEWQADADLYRRDFATVRSIEWVDPAGTVAWVSPAGSDVAGQRFAVTPQRRDLLENTRGSNSQVVSRVLPLLNSDAAPGILSARSVSTSHGFDGWLVAAYEPERLLVEEGSLWPDVGVRWLEAGRAIAELPHADALEPSLVSAPIAGPEGAHWSLALYPSATLARASRSLSPVLTAALIGALSALGWALARAAERARLARRTVHRNLRRLENAHARVAAAEERLRLSLDAVRMGQWEWHGAEDRLHLDSAGRQILGVAPAEDRPSLTTWLQRLGAADQARLRDDLGGRTCDSRGLFHGDYRLARSDGSVAWVDVYGRIAERGDGARPARVIGLVQDVTWRKTLEGDLRAALAQRDVLMRELHHRVKNNLAMLASLVWLQQRRSGDAAVGTALEETRKRLRALALIHDRLHHTGDLTHVEMSAYLRRLVVDLLYAYGVTPRVELRFAAAPLTLTVDRAIPVGLIVNELAMNAVKHAWPPEAPGRFEVELTTNGEDRCRLRVGDDGHGIPGGANGTEPASFGSHLISLLVEQLDGEWSVESDAQGTRVSVDFPLRVRLGADLAA